ncbi:hypothetical protein ADU00_11405 [Salmonella enterica subsp. enterica]|nr:hypothetical protein [Salmonella enterica subsp. enterica serovar Hvittingfoss]
MVNSAADMTCLSDHTRNAKTVVMKVDRYRAIALTVYFADFIIYSTGRDRVDPILMLSEQLFFVFVLP